MGTKTTKATATTAPTAPETSMFEETDIPANPTKDKGPNPYQTGIDKIAEFYAAKTAKALSFTVTLATTQVDGKDVKESPEDATKKAIRTLRDGAKDSPFSVATKVDGLKVTFWAKDKITRERKPNGETPATDAPAAGAPATDAPAASA